METDAALVGTNRVVVLNAITHIGLNLTLVVHPCHTELIYTVGNAEAFDEVHLLEFRVFVVLFFDSAKHFFYCLMILGFTREASFQIFQDFLCVHR